jgi:hypothetical protein
MNLTDNGSAGDSIMVEFLVLLKMYGHRPRKLLNRIKENSEINMKVLPFLLSPRSGFVFPLLSFWEREADRSPPTSVEV